MSCVALLPEQCAFSPRRPSRRSLRSALPAARARAPPATTGSISGTRGEPDWRREAEISASAIAPTTATLKPPSTMRVALRGIGQRTQAAAVLEQASILHPSNRAVLGAYGRALADIGSYAQALEVLNRAHSPDQPDWRILSVQGAVLDQMGRPRGGAALLRERAPDRAGRAVGPVESRPVLRAVQGPAEGREHAAPGGVAARGGPARAPESRAR